MLIAYENIINVSREDFIAQVKETSRFLEIDPSWLMIVIFIESRFNRKAINPTSGAVGLIQWIPRYVCGLLGTSSYVKAQQIILSMSGVQQIQLVEKFLTPYKGRMTDLYQTYLAVFMPVAMGKQDSFVLGDARSTGMLRKVYDWNVGVDRNFGNNDGRLTIMDIKAFVKHHIPKGYVVPLKPRVMQENVEIPKTTINDKINLVETEQCRLCFRQRLKI